MLTGVHIVETGIAGESYKFEQILESGLYVVFEVVF